MSSSGRLYRVIAAFGATAVAAIAVGAVLAVQAAHLHPPPARELAAGCSGIALGRLTPSGLLVLVLIAAGVAVGFRAVAAVGRECLAARRLRRTLLVVARERRAGVPFTLIQDTVPQAFCTGFVDPRICVSTGAVEALSAAELRAVLLHEQHHRRRCDPLRLMLLRVLADALPFLPGLPRIAERCGALAEVAADEAALERTGDRGSLARALLLFGVRDQTAGAVGIAPERVDLLMGRRPGWELPVGLVVAFLLAVVTLTGSVVAADLVLEGSHVDIPLGC